MGLPSGPWPTATTTGRLERAWTSPAQHHGLLTSTIGKGIAIPLLKCISYETSADLSNACPHNATLNESFKEWEEIIAGLNG